MPFETFAPANRGLPFGERIRSTGPASLLNPFQFSTKYLDQETGLSYYGHRYYSPSLGRWINRDPIEEEDGPNVYAFVRNGAINAYDFLGLNNLVEVEGTQTANAGMQSEGWMTLRKIYTNAQEFQQNAADFADMWNLVMDSVQGDPSDLIMEIVNARRDIATFSKDTAGPKHHRLPQRMREIFERAGVEIDREKFVKGISSIIHRRLHGGKGFDNKLGSKALGKKGGMWNFMWRAFMGKESNRTDAKAIEDFSNRMVSFFGI